jgi:alginate O-acetyltransferase complex protein AlgI
LLFNTLEYAVFFGVVFVVSWLLARARKLRVVFLLAASYFFYANWDLRFLPLIWASSTADWLLGNAIARAKSERLRRKWLGATVVLNLGVLGIFKYFDFGVESARRVLEALGYHPPEFALHVALPIGISFFTFESMSYVIDIYRKEIEPHKSYLEYLTFVAFFPHLVAGPIVRPRDLLPQLTNPPRFSPTEGSEGLWLIALGLLKKVAIGDYLAINLVDRVFDAPAQYSALECYAAILGYSVQIYCDFSGYTDVAIGSALLLGVRFPKNFDAPYKAASITEFWRRWHISLSTWLRDYLYIPLGGNRRGRVRTYVNLMLTMLLGGLWHGANWTFVVWGGIHGAALAIERVFRHEHGAKRRLSPGWGAARRVVLVPRRRGGLDLLPRRKLR